MDAINIESVDKESTRPFSAPHLSKKFLCRELNCSPFNKSIQWNACNARDFICCLSAYIFLGKRTEKFLSTALRLVKFRARISYATLKHEVIEEKLLFSMEIYILHDESALRGTCVKKKEISILHVDISIVHNKLDFKYLDKICLRV